MPLLFVVTGTDTIPSDDFDFEPGFVLRQMPEALAFGSSGGELLPLGLVEHEARATIHSGSAPTHARSLAHLLWSSLESPLTRVDAYEIRRSCNREQQGRVKRATA